MVATAEDLLVGTGNVEPHGLKSMSPMIARGDIPPKPRLGGAKARVKKDGILVCIMALAKSLKQVIIKKFSRENGDTGSPEVQVGLLTQKIMAVSQHLEQHQKDNHSRRGLIKMVAKRRRLLDYLRVKSRSRFEELAKAVAL